jgi:hypothetical protein
LEIGANAPLLLYIKELKELDYAKKFGVIMNQRFVDNANRYIVEEDGTRIEREVEEFITKKPYVSQTIVTNTSGTALELQLLLDIPRGTIPLKIYENTQIINIKLDAYVSKTF